ncbi:HTH_Tnp_Tc3_2 domain-containing protein [Trichonephila clavipes]|nr:HTH_Tnp_Tc3_2 domain-containing protein [Trichonephila clavipes]
MTVSRVWNQWVQDDNTEHHTGSQQSTFIRIQEKRHITRMNLIVRESTLRALSQELRSFSRQEMSVRIVLLRLQQHGLSARRPWLRLPTTLHHRL